MEQLSLEEFRTNFRRHTHAVHLEMKEHYGITEEDEPFRRFMAGEDDDYAWRAGYFAAIRAATAAGTVVRRIRVVREPLNDYARFLLHIAPGNIAAGEQIRYLPRDRATGVEFPSEDCWLFDSSRLILVKFFDNGRMDGFYVADDPELVQVYRHACAQAWERATPFAEYVDG
ncbi:DUF6879 family protein [Streptosporangium sp. NPDC004631]